MKWSGDKLPLEKVLAMAGVSTEVVARTLREVSIHTIEDLVEAAQSRQLQTLSGLNISLENHILRCIEELQTSERGLLMDVALFQANEVKQWLAGQKGVERTEIVDDLRRGKGLVRTVEILASAQDGPEVLRSFAVSPLVREVELEGETWADAVSTLGLPVTLHVVKPERFGAALLNLTGSKDHLNQLEELAGHRDLRFDRFLVQADLTEDTIYQQLGLPPIPPELREASGEVEAALAGKLPDLITAHQLRGDLHMHTNWADGLDSIASMADATRARGYHYIGICDHSPLIEEANGLDQIGLQAQAEEIERLNQRYSDFAILRGLEVDIKANGELDLPDEVLLDLDFVIASIHFPYGQDVETVTKRLISAIDHPLVDIIGHPTGRLLKRPDLYLSNVDELVKAAARTGTALEINSGPDRLDLDDCWARKAKEYGVPLIIGSDAHSAVQLDWIRFGLATARRAWLEGAEIMNTLPLAELRKRLKRYREHSSE